MAANVPVDSNILNDYFTSVFKQAPTFLLKQTSTPPNNTYVPCSLFLSPITFNEIINTFVSISNYHAIGSDEIVPKQVKANAVNSYFI